MTRLGFGWAQGAAITSFLFAGSIVWGCAGDSEDDLNIGGNAGTSGIDGGAASGGTSGSGGGSGSGGTGGGVDGGGCPGSQALCGGECSSLDKDPDNCGSCGTACAPGEVCSNGTCALSCGPGLSQCGGSCANTQTDVENCGACGTQCGAGLLCSGGQCGVECQTALTECNGICTNLQNDNKNCGSCGNACPGGQACELGVCTTTCQSGLTLCGGKCTNTQTDNTNCGSCGASCPDGQACQNGVCTVTCGPGQTKCANKCTNTTSDNNNCGGCGFPCGPGKLCSNGACTTSCAPPLELCGNTCTNTDFDPSNCGTCGTACDPGEACSAGICKGIICFPGTTESCYTGPPGTENVGPCKGGTRTCNAQGSGFGPCVGEVLPQTEICSDGIDQNCDGTDGAPLVLEEDFSDNSLGWTLGPDWEIGPAAASSCTSSSTGNDPATDHTPTADNGVAGVLIGACYPTTLHPDHCLTSPAFDTSGLGSVKLSYWRHLHTDYPNFITSKIEVSSNGGTSWTSIFSVPSSTFVNDAAWTFFEYDVTAHKSTNFRVRWCYAAGSSGIIEGGGWNIDDVTISGQCQ